MMSCCCRNSSEAPPRTYGIVSSTGFCYLVTFVAGVLLE